MITLKKIIKALIFTLIITLILSIVFLAFSNPVYAAGEEEIANELPKSEVASWFENNLAWFIGLPTGTVISLILEAVVLYSKNKSFIENIREGKAQRKEVKKFIDDSKLSIDNMKNDIKELKGQMKERFDKSDELAKKINENFTNQEKYIQELINKNDMLTKMLVIQMTHNKEAVANGTAEKINKLAEEYNMQV